MITGKEEVRAFSSSSSARKGFMYVQGRQYKANRYTIDRKAVDKEYDSLT